MRIILILIQKEFLQVFRNKTLLPLIFVLPIVQLLVLVNAATQEMRNIKVVIVDQDYSSLSRQLVSKFDASDFFNVQKVIDNKQDGIELFKNGSSDMILVIKNDTEADLLNNQESSVQILTNAINSTRAQLSFAYARSVISDFNYDLKIELSDFNVGKRIQTQSLFWFNTELNSKYYMLPGILVILLTIIGMFMSAMNLVREKEIGTMEQINVTPVRKSQFIIAKLVPFWIIGIFELTLGLFIGKLVYDIPIVGNLMVLYSFAAVYLIAILGFGLFLSTLANTQQQVMLMSFFFLLVFVMMSGIFTAYENMPTWAKIIDIVNPLYYFMNVVRMVLLKGSGFADVAKYFYGISGIALLIVPLAIWNYRKTS
ncbi:MAG: ABC transporter permease [Marinilabiliaceae bacterium]|nr:ABC transporter permease [Marinilabiliaceae bacterium]